MGIVVIVRWCKLDVGNGPIIPGRIGKVVIVVTRVGTQARRVGIDRGVCGCHCCVCDEGNGPEVIGTGRSTSGSGRVGIGTGRVGTVGFRL